MSFFKKLFGDDAKNEEEKKNNALKAENTNDQYEEGEDLDEDDVDEEDDDLEGDDSISQASLTDSFEPVKPIGNGKAAGKGKPGEVPANYSPDKNNPISVYRNVAGCSRDDKSDYIMKIDSWNWQKYDYETWPCADMSFPDLDEDKSYDLWPFKPHFDMSGHTVHWVDLNNQYKSGIERKAIIRGYKIPDRYIGVDAQKCQIEFEALAKENDASKIQDAGFSNKDHLLYIIESTKKQLKKGYAETQAVIDQTMGKLNQQMNANIDTAKASGLLDPVKGISLQDWAAANAKIASGMPFDEVLKVLSTEKPIWEEASAEWMARMSQDTSFAISKVYGDAFSNSNIGKFAGASASTDSANNPVVAQVKNDMDLYVKIMCHQNIASTQGIDPISILKQYGLTIGDWGVLNGHWSPQFNGNLENVMKMSALMDKYNAEFAAAAPPKAGNDIDF